MESTRSRRFSQERAPSSSAPQPRQSKRIAESKEQELAKIIASFPKDLSHFGLDLSADVAEAMRGGGSATEEHRKGIRGRMNKLRGDTLAKVVPPAYAPLLENQFTARSVTQLDSRVQPESGGAYEGQMFTSTFVTPPEKGSGNKEIPEPRSPRPTEPGTGDFHRGHTAPYSLGGASTNDTRTVWNQSWSNVFIDKQMEILALKAQGQGDEVVNYRLDTHDRSTVGFVSKDTDGAYTATAVQYNRKITE